MCKYVSNRYKVKAMQWTGRNTKEVQEFIKSNYGASSYIMRENGKSLLRIPLSHSMRHMSADEPYDTVDSAANVNDYIVADINGGIFIYGPDLFSERFSSSESLFESVLSLFAKGDTKSNYCNNGECGDCIFASDNTSTGHCIIKKYNGREPLDCDMYISKKDVSSNFNALLENMMCHICNTINEERDKENEFIIKKYQKD